MTTPKRKKAGFEQGNRRAAEIILSDVQRYGCEKSLMIRWARLVLNRAERTEPAAQRIA